MTVARRPRAAGSLNEARSTERDVFTARRYVAPPRTRPAASTPLPPTMTGTDAPSSTGVSAFSWRFVRASSALTSAETRNCE
jgi:hypothetical protein